MWLAGIPFFILAFHQRGLFEQEDITIYDVREKVKRGMMRIKDCSTN
jgi:hypothetical protein